MSRYVARRLLFAVPTLLAISFIVFALLDLAPNDPTAQLPLTIPPATRQAIKESLGLGQPFHVRYVKWLDQFMVNEPTTFAGAIITEQIFRINGVGQLLIGAIEAGDIPTVQTVTFIFAVLIVVFNLVADVLYGVLDPRIRYG